MSAPCPGRLALCGVPCGCNGENRSHYPPTRLGGVMNDSIETAAAIMVEKADRWYYAEREICGRLTDTHPPCVKSLHHGGDCDGFYEAPWEERFTAWIGNQIAEGRAEMARDEADR